VRPESEKGAEVGGLYRNLGDPYFFTQSKQARDSRRGSARKILAIADLRQSKAVEIRKEMSLM